MKKTQNKQQIRTNLVDGNAPRRRDPVRNVLEWQHKKSPVRRQYNVTIRRSAYLDSGKAKFRASGIAPAIRIVSLITNSGNNARFRRQSFAKVVFHISREV